MRILGVNCLNHDAAISVIEDGEIIFAAHAERYSRKKNDMHLNDDIVEEALGFGDPDELAYYEKPWLKKSRQLYAGQYSEVFNTGNLPQKYLTRWFPKKKIRYVDHHESHAAAGYFTSPFDDCVVVVIDGIGEWDVATIWHASRDQLSKIYSVKYPHSLGIFYSAMTQRLGLKPCEEEYILMGMSAWGEDLHSSEMYHDFFIPDNTLRLKHNLHQGIGDYQPGWEDFNIAASAQVVTEKILCNLFLKARELVPHNDNLVFMGGVALNCVANSTVVSRVYPNVWIMPNPGDAGSSLGCAASLYGRKLNWRGPFLGTNIDGEYPTPQVLSTLLEGNIVGVANGRAEFGPRALGNRSLLADPRGPTAKDKVNEIKRRQKFRPFAPAVLEEKAKEFFDMPVEKVPYMQFIAKCKRPDLFPAICHVDNTSRVQTVSEKENPGFYGLINEFYKKTGCPMLLNTSLNIKGQPIVNTEKHAREFEEHYNVKVFTSR
jgi:carbamoyltransferase